MRSLPIIAVALLLSLPFNAEAAQDVFPPSMVADSVTLEKTGEGTFRWMFIKVYTGAFYLDARSSGAGALDDVAKRLELRYAVGISADQFRESGNKILQKNVGEDLWENLQERLSTLNAAYQSVEDGDSYALTYLPGQGTTLSLNGSPLVTVEGDDFARAYFSIWLGETPAKASFRDALLGNP